MPVKLYKLDSKNLTRVWWAEALSDGYYRVSHGLEGGKIVEEMTLAVAKNVGRSNATSPEQQAEREVAALYAKKLERENYKKDLNDETKFFQPMKARDFSEVPHQVPEDILLWLTPKLNGVRCLWDPIKKKLISKRGLIYHIPQIEKTLQDCNEFIDGEIYKHGVPLNEIASATKKTNELTPQLEFHVFDIANTDWSYPERHAKLRELFDSLKVETDFVFVLPYVLRYKRELREVHDLYLRQGYEGLMMRIPDLPYEPGIRSRSIFKWKDFKEQEFLIKGVHADKEGGAVLECEGFDVRCRGTDEYRHKQLLDKDQLIGKLVTVRYPDFTAFGVPQFPVGIVVRDYE